MIAPQVLDIVLHLGMVVPLIWMLICSVLDLAALLLRVMTWVLLMFSRTAIVWDSSKVAVAEHDTHFTYRITICHKWQSINCMTALHVHTQRKCTTPANMALPVQRNRIAALLPPPPKMKGLADPAFHGSAFTIARQQSQNPFYVQDNNMSISCLTALLCTHKRK